MVIKFRSLKDWKKYKIDLACYGTCVLKTDKNGYSTHVNMRDVFSEEINNAAKMGWKDLAKYIIPRKARKVCK